MVVVLHLLLKYVVSDIEKLCCVRVSLGLSFLSKYLFLDYINQLLLDLVKWGSLQRDAHYLIWKVHYEKYLFCPYQVLYNWYGRMELIWDYPDPFDFQTGFGLTGNDYVDSSKGFYRICYLKVNCWLKLVCLWENLCVYVTYFGDVCFWRFQHVAIKLTTVLYRCICLKLSFTSS